MKQVLCLALSAFHFAGYAQQVQSWSTTENLSSALQPEPLISFEPISPTSAAVVQIDREHKFQTILGIGASFEHSTCSNLFRVTPEERQNCIADLVDPVAGAAMNLMRICIGTSDFSGEPWYSYDDLPAGETDPELQRFSIDRDRAYILPVLKIAQQKNPALLFFASPWSPPGWMKTTGTMIGGELKPEFARAYAQYFVRFIQAYEAEGLPIYAVTVQNEPGVDRSKDKPQWHYPSCHWTADQERDFIRDHLGPALRRAGLKTKIWCYDHNYNIEKKGDSAGLSHPRAILQDRVAAGFVDGVAFHHYEGQPSGMTLFHQEFPNSPIHFTEGSVFSIYGGHDLIERFRNWAVSYNAWVSLLDEAGRPNNGPFEASIAILRLDSKTGRCQKLLEYYNYAHFSRFVKRGAQRISSTPGSSEFNNVAFLNPDGSVAVIMVNTTGSAKPVALRAGSKQLEVNLAARSLRTLTWQP